MKGRSREREKIDKGFNGIFPRHSFLYYTHRSGSLREESAKNLFLSFLGGEQK